MMENKIIEVVAVAIIQKQKVLIAQRPKCKDLGLLWEFPGGKIEANESLEECAIREIKEELDIEIVIDKYMGESIYKYEFGYIKMHLYSAKIKSGEIKLLEHNALSWVDANEIDLYDFPPVDIPFLEPIKELLNYARS